jgi:nitrite reductase/ring-hydroxylating ferredoxin subunit
VNSTLDKGKSKRKLVGQVGELADGESKKFTLRCGGISVEAFLISYEGSLHAYLNRCRHIALSLDWLDNQFFSEDKRFLICANHGATYEPKTGECIWGPCAGASLQGVPLEIEGQKIFARCPELKSKMESSPSVQKMLREEDGS